MVTRAADPFLFLAEIMMYALQAVLSLLQLAGAVGIANIVPALSQMPARRAVLYLVPAICHCITNVRHPHFR